MFPSSPNAMSWRDAIDARWPGMRRRAGPIVLTAIFEILLVLVLLSLGAGDGQDQPRGETVATFDAVQDDAPEPDEPQAEARVAAPVEPTADLQAPSPSALPIPPPIALPPTPTAPAVAPPEPPAEATPSPAEPKMRAVMRSDMASNRGPADTGNPGDSQRIAGSGPNGEPLYAAKWYREPTDDEYRGYFSRVSGSGWALINCQTEPEFRVDHCVLVDEWPDRSGLGSAVLAMAWQFRVRPPRVGGRSLVGEWVRIRIDYTITRQ